MLFNNFLSRLNGVKRSGNSYVACCPAHDDKNPSLSVCLSEDGKKILIHCFAGCSDEAILDGLGLKQRDLFITEASPAAASKTTRYEYRDEDGTLLYTKTRYDKPDGTKTFSYMQPNGSRNLKDAKRVPYNLPAVCTADTVFFVEGEKCADAVNKQGYTATTLDCGAKSKWLPEYDEYFAEKWIVILPDNDAPGAKYAQMIKRHLPRAVVKLLPDLVGKGDVADWLAAGHRMEEVEAIPAFEWEEASEEDDDAPGTDQSSLLLQFAEKAGVQMFCDENRTPYAEVTIGGKKRIIQAESSEFSLYLQSLFFMEAKKPIGKARLGAAMGVLISKAVFQSDRIRLQNRIAQHENRIYYDLSDGEGTAVRASTDGWEITKETPQLFAQYRHQKPQTIPRPGGSLEAIFQHINMKQYKLLFLCWLVSCFVPDIPHPITVIYGEKGAAKSTACVLLKRLIDPSTLEALTLSKDEKDLIVAMQQHYYLPFDNVSAITHDTSDTLCKAVMGAAIQQRKLHTNGDDYIFTFQRCISINGISNVANKSDLLDRTIMLELERVEPRERKELREVYRAFEIDRPIILGAIFDTLSKAMQLYPTVKLPEYPRMADFCRWGYAIAEALGYEGAQFVEEYKENSCIQNEEAINADSVAFLMVEFMRIHPQWTGRASALLKELNALAGSFGINVANNIPRSPCHLSRRLKAVKSNLEEVGIRFEFDHKNSSGTFISVTKKMAPLPSYQVEIPESLSAIGSNPDITLNENGGNGVNEDNDEEDIEF